MRSMEACQLGPTRATKWYVISRVPLGRTSIHAALFLCQALRIVLKTLESAANRYGRFITPLLSMSADFYVRIFVQIHSSALEAKKGARYELFLLPLCLHYGH